MRLRSFRIQNYARLQDMTVEVRDHLVLVGPNDVGKSSVLRCLDLLLGATAAQLYARIRSTDLRDAGAPLIITASFDTFCRVDKQRFPDAIAVDAATGELSLEVRLEAELESEETLDIRRFMPQSGSRRQLTRDELAALGWRMVGAISSIRDLRDDRNAALDDILNSVDLGAERVELRTIVDQLGSKLATSQTFG